MDGRIVELVRSCTVDENGNDVGLCVWLDGWVSVSYVDVYRSE